MTGFFDGGAKSMSFGKVGSQEAQAVFGKWRGGPVINIGEPKQQTDWQDRTPKTWPGGDPIMQLPITVDTRAGKCPEPMIDDEDDGVRDWYITKGRQDFQALKAALRKAGVSDIAVGGELYGRWHSGVGQKGDPRLFEFVYQPPVQTSGGFMADGPGEQAPPAGMPPQVPPAQPPHQPYPDAVAANTPRFDPQTGQPLAPPPAAAAPAPRFDPATGQPLAPAQPAAAPEPPRFDPATGAPLNDAARAILAGNQPAAAPQPGPAAQPAGNPFARR